MEHLDKLELMRHMLGKLKDDAKERIGHKLREKYHPAPKPHVMAEDKVAGEPHPGVDEGRNSDPDGDQDIPADGAQGEHGYSEKEKKDPLDELLHLHKMLNGH